MEKKRSSQSRQTRRLRSGVRLRVWLDGLAAICMVAASVIFIWAILGGGPDRAQSAVEGRGTQRADLPKEPIDFERGAVQGSEGARVGVILYSDFECPYCGTFARDTLPQVVAQYVDTGKIRFAFRHLPLERIHRNARLAAEAAECARKQGRFWELHDALFAQPRRLQRDQVVEKAGATGVDRKQLERCLDGDADSSVSADLAEARELAVNGTPTFFFGRVEQRRLKVLRRESGALPITVFTSILDELLETK